MLHRPRRLRTNRTMRSMVRETWLQPTDFIYPMFVVEGTGIRREIPSMPGNYHFSLDELEKELKKVAASGIAGVIFFGVPEQKDETGSGAWDENGLVPQALRLFRKVCPDQLAVADVCLCEYTSHGHCGLVQEGRVLNDPTVDLLSRTSLCYARAGADIIAPSDMMDGRIGAIREALDKEGFEDVSVMAYSVKYASAFYGPFREAANSAPQFGDRKAYQMDPANRRDALREAALDVAEGADILMVKPAMAYLDIIRTLADRHPLPMAAYQVSGEYAMIKAAAANGWISEKAVALEALTSIKRAGAGIILTYYALEAAEWLKEPRN